MHGFHIDPATETVTVYVDPDGPAQGKLEITAHGLEGERWLTGDIMNRKAVRVRAYGGLVTQQELQEA